MKPNWLTVVSRDNYPTRRRGMTRRARFVSAVVLFAFAGCALFAMLAMLNGCGTVQPKGDEHLTGKAGELFRRLTGAQAMTINDRIVIYGGKNPPSAYVICHEGEHKKQAKLVGDVLVKYGMIDDDELSRTKSWIDVYSTDWMQRGYAGNRFERGAHEACKALLD